MQKKCITSNNQHGMLLAIHGYENLLSFLHLCFFYSKAEKYNFIVKREICQCTLLSPSEGFDEIKLGLPVVNDFSHVILGRSTSSSFPNVALS